MYSSVTVHCLSLFFSFSSSNTTVETVLTFMFTFVEADLLLLVISEMSN